MSLVTDEEAVSILEEEMGDDMRSRTMIFADAWERIVLLILDRLNPDGGEPWKVRRGLAGRLANAWRAILPFATSDPEAEFPFSGEALEVLQDYYRLAENLRALVRVLTPADASEQLGQLDRIEEFCRVSLKEIEGITATHQILVTGEGFNALVSCHQEMLTIVLGPQLTETFTESYDRAMATVNAMLQASRTTGPAN